MTKYIDVDKLWNRLISVSENDWVGFDTIDEVLSGMPAADVMEVVRCRDCKHNPMRSFTGCPMAGIEKRKTTDYCSYGERRDA